MNQVLFTILSLSLSGTLMIGILLLFKPLIQRYFNKRWQYYIWVIVIARLLIPYSPKGNLIGSMVMQWSGNQSKTMDAFSPKSDISDEVLILDSEKERIYSSNVNDWRVDLKKAEVVIENEEIISNQNGIPTKEQKADVIHSKKEKTDGFDKTVSEQHVVLSKYLLDSVWVLWAVIAMVLFLYKIVRYHRFLHSIKGGLKPVEDIEVLERYSELLEQARIHRVIEIYTNPQISSPSIVGMIHPIILIPSVDLSQNDFKYTILHELVHYKRKDYLYKWVLQVVLCIHWMNPFVYWMKNEINRLCELSCDEVVICNLDSDSKYDYGTTLLNALRVGGKIQDNTVLLSFYSSKELIKERLESILSYQKTTWIKHIVSFICIIIIVLEGSFLGSYQTLGAVNLSEYDHRIIGTIAFNPLTMESTEEVPTDSEDNVEVEKIEEKAVASIEDYYNQYDKERFLNLFWNLNNQEQEDYLMRMFVDEKFSMFHDAVKNVPSSIADLCAKKAYEEGVVTYFDSVSPYISNRAKKELIKLCKKDNRGNYLAILSEDYKRK